MLIMAFLGWSKYLLHFWNISLKNNCLLHTRRPMTRLANASLPNMLILSCLQWQWVSCPGLASSNKVMDIQIHVNQYNFIILLLPQRASLKRASKAAVLNHVVGLF